MAATIKNPQFADLPVAPPTLPDAFGARRDASVAFSRLCASGNITHAKNLRDWYIAMANQADLIAGGTGSGVSGGVA